MLHDRQSVARDQRTPSRPEIGRRGRTVGVRRRRAMGRCRRSLLVPNTMHDLWPARDVAAVLVRDVWVAAKPTR
jgi:hypothetical protein